MQVIRSIWFSWAILVFSVAQTWAAGPSAVKHVLLIGLDGARADAIRDNAGPAIRSLIDHGTVCWQAHAVQPSVTQVNWASILTGSRPETHGIDMNPVIEAQLRQVKLKVPTLFDLIAKNGGTSAGFLGHWKLYPNESKTPGAVTFHSPYESSAVAEQAAKYIIANKPTFCFVYMGDLDGIGHRDGWMSPNYMKGIGTLDAAVTMLLNALDQAGMRQETAIFLTSDHGGHEKSHSEGTAEDLNIPWIACGPSIPENRTINRPISTIDTAPTIAQWLGITATSTFDGVAVNEAASDDAVSPQPRSLAADIPPAPKAAAHSQPISAATTAPSVAADALSIQTETIVFLRHGEIPPGGLGQLAPQGLNRALALSHVLISKYGKPDALFAPNPSATRMREKGGQYDYVRPLATIEPTAIELGMPVQTPCGFSQIDVLNTALTGSNFARATIFVAWEHAYAEKAAADLMKRLNGETATVPHWSGSDFDSLYVLRIIRVPGQPPTITFTHDQEGLNHLSKAMPVPAPIQQPPASH